jgi:guanosine-3',5'-bis(diphosphate) 3'-pyrophosphohydrolase
MPPFSFLRLKVCNGIDMNKVLEEIRDFADRAHGEQKRKYTPERYIVHPVRVMQICEQYMHSLPVLAAALLHDVLEDTPVSKKEIEAFLSERMSHADAIRTVHLVVELTDVYIKANYPQWNRRKRKQQEVNRMAKTSAEAQTIKYADIIDNCREIVAHDPDFARVFLSECYKLLKEMKRGNPELYKLALEEVERGLKLLR